MVASANDVQATDPVFYLRCASQRHHHQQSLAKQTRGPQATNSLQPVPEQQDRPGLRPSPSDMSVYATPSEEVPPDSELLPQQLPTSPSKQEIIAAQRAASRANQSAMISAQKNNSMGGVDITLRDRGTLRSSVVATDPNGQRRYSFIDANGAETDVSELVEAEWSSPRNQPDENRIRSPSALSTATTVTDAASFKSALQSPTRTASSTVDDEDAIAALRDAQLSIGNRPSSSLDRDHLQDALPKRSPSSETSEYSRRSHDIDDRISRVLAKVKQPHDRASSSLRNGRSSSASGRSSPAVSARDSPAQGHTTHSPAFSRSRTNSVEILNNASNGTRTPERLHSKQPSVSSSLSEATVSSQYSNGISNTVNTTATTVSPGVSARDHSRASQRLVYPADLGGVDHLLTILAPGPASYPNPTQLQNGAERLFGPDLHAHRQTLTDPEIRDWFDEKVGHLLDIEQVGLSIR